MSCSPFLSRTNVAMSSKKRVNSALRDPVLIASSEAEPQNGASAFNGRMWSQ